MNDIDIIKKAVSKKHRCDPVHEAIARIEGKITKISIACGSMAMAVQNCHEMLSDHNMQRSDVLKIMERMLGEMLEMLKEDSSE